MSRFEIYGVLEKPDGNDKTHIVIFGHYKISQVSQRDSDSLASLLIEFDELPELIAGLQDIYDVNIAIRKEQQ